ncbi:MAG: hypothetical protein A2W80_13340 [Candidatus Riflebacteria bacterium GWC2_50_8]|nr:MAG: hypothetical protein A2W80_13340 [Candidatus Riflebacteria bacterium GWC2_50_8]
MTRKGFTLIELLVVITILAVLAGAALPYVQNYVEESRIAKAKTDLEEIARALAVYETREGDYPDTGAVNEFSDVSQLTGRYLNKAPIDPWGKPYTINRDAGTVYSTGPDRDDSPGGKYDNISVPYQPPLALVSVKWVDKNQTGSVDINNVPDQLHLGFSRKIQRINGEFEILDLNAWFEIDPDGEDGPLPYEALHPFVEADDDGGSYPPNILSERTLVLSLNPGYPVVNSISLGAALIRVADPKGQDTVTGGGDDLSDNADNLCLVEQQVKILPQ